jgi:hypothetical protein
MSSSPVGRHPLHHVPRCSCPGLWQKLPRSGLSPEMLGESVPGSAVATARSEVAGLAGTQHGAFVSTASP